MPDKTFLETYPLYRKFPLTILAGSQIGTFSKPAIHMYCVICQSEQTYNMTNNYEELGTFRNNAIDIEAVRAKYTCSSCGENNRYFFLKFFSRTTTDNDGDKVALLEVYKIGQYPPWSIDVNSELALALDTEVDLYKKGLICESQSYGIGAYAYYRRVVENKIESLLDAIKDLMSSAEAETYIPILEQVKKAKVAEEKIALAKELLPASLRPEGINPLDIIYESLSVGIHSDNDDECLDRAVLIKEAIIFLLTEIIKRKAESKKFTDNMRKLLEKKKNK